MLFTRPCFEVLNGFPILFQGAYTDFEFAWYNKVMSMIMCTAIINSVMFPLGRAMPAVRKSLMRRSCVGCMAHSQKARPGLFIHR